jgi:hypothetical protein
MLQHDAMIISSSTISNVSSTPTRLGVWSHYSDEQHGDDNRPIVCFAKPKEVSEAQNNKQKNSSFQGCIASWYFSFIHIIYNSYSSSYFDQTGTRASASLSSRIRIISARLTPPCLSYFRRNSKAPLA